MEVSLNLNYLLVLGLVLCIIILIFMLIKHIFVPDKDINNLDIRGDNTKKNLPDNIDFFNNGVKIIEKSNNRTFTENNKLYHIIDIGDKILIMEDTLYYPQEESEKNLENILNSKTLELEEELFEAEKISSSFEEEILSTSNLEDMKNIIDNSQDSLIENEDVQGDLFNYYINESINVSDEVSNENNNS